MYFHPPIPEDPLFDSESFLQPSTHIRPGAHAVFRVSSFLLRCGSVPEGLLSSLKLSHYNRFFFCWCFSLGRRICFDVVIAGHQSYAREERSCPSETEPITSLSFFVNWKRSRTCSWKRSPSLKNLEPVCLNPGTYFSVKNVTEGW